ncbi:MAG TPA: sigma-54 dependent transcriptional regulator [Chthoniobacteraceae bacterium]|nr:sigma-54 dependent transcriptional regulator [Chthoniobacteraceae bacterium]
MHVLIVDDEKNIRLSLSAALESMKHEVSLASTSAGALQELKKSSIDVVLLDLRLSQESGLDLLDEIRRLSPRAAVIVVTAFGSIETAVEAMRRGAFDFLAKPCTPEQLRQVLARVERMRRLENRVAELESRVGSAQPEMNLKTHSPVLQKAFDVAFKAAESDATILLLGESGTGKSMLARAIHQRSTRAQGAFVTVSCPSLSRELLESELFGHAKGAFTGAHADTLGKVAAADGGTLFLDEIGELPVEIQSKLLRLLQEREYERVGETKSHRSNVRVVAATNRNLKEAVASGKFREDLFYRLNVISVTLPPLRERAADIEDLVGGQLQSLAAHAGKPARDVSPAALEMLRHYHWPGNIRELRNVMERAVILSAGPRIETADVGEIAQDHSEVRLGGKVSLAEIEQEHIRRVVEGSRTLEEAAQVLGIDPATLYRKRKKLV